MTLVASIGRGATRGGALLLAAELVTRIGTLLGILVLASTLTPSDFGLAAIASLALLAVSSGFGLGIGAALQSLERSDALDRTSLGLALITGMTGALLLVLLAPSIARLLGDADATSLIRGIAPMAIMLQWSEVRAAILERDFLFKKTAFIRIVSSLVGTSTAIALAISGAGVWALVAQGLVGEGGNALLLTIVRHGPKWPRITNSSLRELWAVCRQLLGNGIWVFIFTNADDAFVSRLAGTANLGYYSFAYRISNTPTYIVSQRVGRVMLPALTALAQANRSWRNAYSRTLHLLSWAAGGVMFFIMIHGPSLLVTVYGQRWQSSYHVLQILSLYGLIRMLASPSGAVFLASGKPQWLRRYAQWLTITMLLLIVPAIVWLGILGASLAVTVPGVVAGWLAIRRAGAICDLSVGGVLRTTLPPLAAGASANLAAIPLVALAPGLPGFILAGVVVLLGWLAYGFLAMRADLKIVLDHLKPSARR